MSNQNILYIRGLGGAKTLILQKAYIAMLNYFRADKIYFFEPNWEKKGDADAENNDAKKQRLDDFFEANGHPGIIYANSAGAALAVQLTIRHATVIESCHLVCGKVTGHANFSENHNKRAPSFKPIVKQSEQLLNNISPKIARKFNCYIPKDSKNDGVLDVTDMIVPGAKTIYLPRLQHNWAIFYAALRYMPKL